MSNVILIPLLNLLVTVMGIVQFFVILRIIMSWLVAFGIVNAYGQVSSMINEFSFRLTEPLIGPFRRILPNIEGIDLSPLALLLAIHFLRDMIENLILQLH